MCIQQVRNVVSNVHPTGELILRRSGDEIKNWCAMIKTTNDEKACQRLDSQAFQRFRKLIVNSIHTEDADTGLINEVLYPLISATASAICTRDTRSGPPTFSSNCICLPSGATIMNVKIIDIEVQFSILHIGKKHKYKPQIKHKGSRFGYSFLSQGYPSMNKAFKSIIMHCTNRIKGNLDIATP